MTGLLIDLYGPLYFKNYSHSLVRMWQDRAMRETTITNRISSAGEAVNHAVAMMHQMEDPVKLHRDHVSTRKEDRQYSKRVAIHEALHFTGLSLNDLLTASAFEWYVDAIEKAHKGAVPAIAQNLEEVEEAMLEKYARIAHYNGNVAHAEHGAGEKEKPFRHELSKLGRLLGQAAINVEVSLAQPGIGLFLIRDVSLGRKFVHVVFDIQSGKFEKQRQQLLKRQGFFEATLLRSPFYAEQRLEKIRRARQKNRARAQKRRSAIYYRSVC